jgi:transposase
MNEALFRSNRGDRSFVNAVVWLMKTGSPWRDLPDRYGNWKTVYNRFANWATLRSAMDRCPNIGPLNHLAKPQTGARRERGASGGRQE